MNRLTIQYPIYVKREVIFPLCFFGVGAFLFAVLPIDFFVNDFFFNFDARAWYFGDSWWANQLIHKAGNNLVKFVAVFSVILLGLACFPKWRIWRRTALFILLSMGLSTGLVALGKQTTNMDCPFHLDHYNGDRPYYSLFSDKPDTVKRGKCFPGGHSSGAFSLVFLYFLFRERIGTKRFAQVGLYFAIGLGLTYAFGQWVRGAHFPSHDWYSFFTCYFISLCLYRFVFKTHVMPYPMRFKRTTYQSLGSISSSYPHFDNS